MNIDGNKDDIEKGRKIIDRNLRYIARGKLSILLWKL